MPRHPREHFDALERGLPQSLDDDGPSRVFAAALQGHWQTAVSLMVSLPEDDWEEFVMAVGGLHGLLNTIARDRRARVRVVNNCVPCPQNPPATSG